MCQHVLKHSNKVMCEYMLLIIAFHQLKVILFVVTVSFADLSCQIQLTNTE